MQSSRRSGSIITSLKREISVALFLLLFAALSLAATDVRAQTPSPEEDADKQEESVQVKAAAAPAKSIVRGRVIYEDTNRPVRRARIMLLPASGKGGPEHAGVTDAHGEFRIESVAAGSYFVVVDAPGIITPFSQIDIAEAANEKATLLSIRKEFEEVSVNGTNSVEVQVRARRGGAITGRITYAEGDPAINVPVTILRKKDGRLIRFITSFSQSALMGFKTDDRGVYRIAGLPSGEYIVGAVETYGPGNSGEDFSEYALFGKGSLSTNYYQNETNPRQATPVKVEAGQEATEINITLVERATYTISGTVVARQGRAPVRARIGIQPKSEDSQNPFFDSSQGTPTDAAGRWTIPNVPDGAYIITVDPILDYYLETEETDVTVGISAQSTQGPRRPARPPSPSFTRRQQDVTVSGADLSGIVIELSEGGRVQGTVAVEGNKKFLQGGANILLVAIGGTSPFEKYGSVQEDGKFMFDAVPPGEFYLYLPGAGEEYYIKAMSAGGTDLLREPLKIGQGTNIDNVVITVSSEVATLAGRVLSSEDSKPVRGASVLVVPADPARWRFVNTFLYGSTDGAGTFKVTGAPGAYLVVTLAAGDQLSGLNETFIRARAATAKQVSLQPNGRETIELIAPAERQQ